MTIGHMTNNIRPFRANPKLKGGSKKGKPQGEWPLIFLVAADAILCAAKGSSEAWKIDRRARITLLQFHQRLDRLLPGWSKWLDENMGARKTPWAKLLLNRVYKMYYSGTSDRGPGHNPATRASESDEHWRKRIPAPDLIPGLGSPYEMVHDEIARGVRTTIKRWKSLARLDMKHARWSGAEWRL